MLDCSSPWQRSVAAAGRTPFLVALLATAAYHPDVIAVAGVVVVSLEHALQHGRDACPVLLTGVLGMDNQDRKDMPASASYWGGTADSASFPWEEVLLDRGVDTSSCAAAYEQDTGQRNQDIAQAFPYRHQRAD